MFPTQVGRLPLIVVLDRDEELRAFLNVCRHRGTELVSEPQRRGTIQCPYHAWTYRAAPASGALEHGRLLTRTEALVGAFQDMVRARLS